jgi:hypothetical protein
VENATAAGGTCITKEWKGKVRKMEESRGRGVKGMKGELRECNGV